MLFNISNSLFVLSQSLHDQAPGEQSCQKHLAEVELIEGFVDRSVQGTADFLWTDLLQGPADLLRTDLLQGKADFL